METSLGTVFPREGKGQMLKDDSDGREFISLIPVLRTWGRAGQQVSHTAPSDWFFCLCTGDTDIALCK